MINQAVKAYQEYYERILPTGSRVICSTPPNDTDEDYLLFCTIEQRPLLEQRLREEGWHLGGSFSNGTLVQNISFNGVQQPVTSPNFTLNTEHQFKEDGSIDATCLFHSWKKDDLNIIVTCNQQYFEDFTRATFLARALDLKDKSDRIVLFQALCQDMWPIERKKKPVLGINHPGWNPAEPQSATVSNMTANGWVQIAPGTWTIPINFSTPVDPPVNPPILDSVNNGE